MTCLMHLFQGTHMLVIRVALLYCQQALLAAGHPYDPHEHQESPFFEGWFLRITTSNNGPTLLLALATCLSSLLGTPVQRASCCSTHPLAVMQQQLQQQQTYPVFHLTPEPYLSASTSLGHTHTTSAI
jgi:hypothetical protein